MTKHLTVVYTIHDEEAFEPVRKQIFDSMKDSKGEPFAATAVSLDHEMQRTHWYERAAEEIDDYYDLRDVMDSIAGHPDIGSVKSLDELRGFGA